jgi:hypothetical protein
VRRRILLTGGCQIAGIGAALRLLMPDDDVVAVSVPGLVEVARRDRFAPDFASAAVWVSQFPRGFLGLDEHFPALPPRFVRLPNIEFAAYHPDNTAASSRRAAGAALRGAYQTPYCSAILYWAWKRSLSDSEAEALFCPEVFRALGYLDAWPASVAWLRAEFEKCDVAFDPFFLRIQRTGNFMHSHNHPRIGALAELARELARLLGAPPERLAEPLVDLLDDGLAPLSWPVYPGVAERCGLRGSYRWRLGTEVIPDLPTYVRLTLAAYRTQDPDEFYLARADAPEFTRAIEAGGAHRQ